MVKFFQFWAIFRKNKLLYYMKIVEIKTKLMKFDKFLKKKQNYGNLTIIVGYWLNYRIWPKLCLLKYHSNVQNFSSPAYTKLPTVFIIMTFNIHLNVMLTYPIPKYPITKITFLFICFIRTFHFNQLLDFLISGAKKGKILKNQWHFTLLFYLENYEILLYN